MKNCIVDEAVGQVSLVDRLARIVASAPEDGVCLACCSAVGTYFGARSGFTVDGIPEGVHGFRTSGGVEVHFELNAARRGVDVLVHTSLPDTGNECVYVYDLINDFMDWLPYVKGTR